MQVRRLLVGRATEDASVSVLGAKFRLPLVADEVAGGVEPLGALLALDDELPFVVGRGARRALAQGGAGSAEGAVGLVSPVGVEARLVGAANLADGAPLALPVALRHVVQRRLHAVNVVRDVALVAQEQTGLVVTLATPFAHGTVQAAPALLQNDFGDLDVGTERMVALQMDQTDGKFN